jgi:hypothetical protein
MWWAGYSYGPRFMTDILPIFAYFLAFAVSWMYAYFTVIRAVLLIVFAVLAGASFLIHAHGAIDMETDAWNSTPVSVDKQPGRVWDWEDLQFLRGLKIRDRGSLIDLPVDRAVPAVAHLAETISFRRNQAKPDTLMSGWSTPVAEGSWSVDAQPTLVLRVPELTKRIQPVRLIVLLRTDVAGKLSNGVQVIVNDVAVSSWNIDERSRQMITFVPSDIVARRGGMHIAFRLAAGNVSNDEAYGAHILLEEIRLEATNPQDP